MRPAEPVSCGEARGCQQAWSMSLSPGAGVCSGHQQQARNRALLLAVSLLGAGGFRAARRSRDDVTPAGPLRAKWPDDVTVTSAPSGSGL
ncbi:hypothetical protein AAFF_G00035350 [Aldrovandia affinis]|uniref:Uncharacterized protein n=1 Tax=Aldrovandia affinis TaxID=143900 RepID=A0AAD7S328_9TELE|nr:hypothetical protein AAFF_G00035350 [Aldrovandia affinis]